MIMKRFFAISIAILLSANVVYGAILGNEINSWSHTIAKETELNKTEFISDQNGVGRQTEYYVKYTPNNDVQPVVVGNNTVWGLQNIAKTEEYMKSSGLIPLMGINASFFSFQTGIPMGLAVSDKRIITKDAEEYHTIGFNSDGTAFIAPLKITTMLKSGDTELEISHINKFNQELTPIINLYTPDFDDNNHNDIQSLTLVLDEIEGILGIGDTLTAVVSDKFNYCGAVKIPEGQFLLTLNENSDETLYGQLNSLEVGDKIEISSYCDDERWKKVEYAMGSVGDRLIENGIVKSGFANGAAPRSAVGITERGEVIFYVLDGRQSGYSYGAKIETVAKRLKELGCVDAINLDGGGSTSLFGTYPGKSESEVINSPSEGVLRRCANYIFVKNNAVPTGEFGGAYFYPFEQHYLSGYSEEIFLTAVDSSFYPILPPENIEISVSGDSSIDKKTNILTANGTGLVTVTANYNGISTDTFYHSYETPTDIFIKDKDGNVLESINLKSGDEKELIFEAWYNGIRLKSSTENFNVAITDGLGYFDNNVLKITSNGGEGILSVSAGDCIYQIPVIVENEYPFSDIFAHWAKERIKYVYEQGIVSGYKTESGLSFLPQKNISREEFALIICRMINENIDGADNVENCTVQFSDIDQISDWARQYVFAMANKGAISGRKVADGKVYFSPKAPITRAEAITILSRILNIHEIGTEKFADDYDIPEWAREAVYQMVSYGLISGYEDNSIRPNTNVTRAEAVSMIYEIITH